MIECDGSQHFTGEGLEVDRIRDEALAQLGLKVLRFDNRQVMGQIDDVVDVVYRYCLKQSPFDIEGLHTNMVAFGDFNVLV